MAEGEPVFFGIILFFAGMVILGIGANLGLVPPPQDIERPLGRVAVYR